MFQLTVEADIAVGDDDIVGFQISVDGHLDRTVFTLEGADLGGYCKNGMNRVYGWARHE